MAAGHLHGRVADEATPVTVNTTSRSQDQKSSDGKSRTLSNTQIRTEGASREAPSVYGTFCSAKISIEWPEKGIESPTRGISVFDELSFCSVSMVLFAPLGRVQLGLVPFWIALRTTLQNLHRSRQHAFASHRPTSDRDMRGVAKSQLLSARAIVARRAGTCWVEPPSAKSSRRACAGPACHRLLTPRIALPSPNTARA